MDVLVRQAHPGPGAPAYASSARKMEDAERHRDQQGIPWPVLVDDVGGTMHLVYGGLADPAYVVDAEGRVAYYQLWTHAPTLHTALDALARRGGVGVVDGGLDRRPHLLAAMAGGWPALRPGLPQSVTDLMTAAPGLVSSAWLGYQLRPLLAPLALRATPLPRPARIGLAVGAVLVGLAVGWALRRRRSRSARRLALRAG